MKVESVSWTESATHEPVERDDGSVEITIAEPDAINIDKCERALLQTAYPTLREALSTHFSEMSKKKPLSR